MGGGAAVVPPSRLPTASRRLCPPALTATRRCTWHAGLRRRHFGEMSLGDTIELKGPLQKFTYTPNMKKYIGMIAGGQSATLLHRPLADWIAGQLV